jgi:MFS family permease
VLCGWLSDKVGRKPIMLLGFALASLTFFPIYWASASYFLSFSQNFDGIMQCRSLGPHPQEAPKGFFLVIFFLVT